MPNFPASIIAAAKKAQADWSVPSSVSMAQWAIESGYGKHMPTGSNNPFGIKAVPGQKYVTAKTREVIKGKSVIIPQEFRKFASIADAFDEHARLLATNKVYAPAMTAWTKPPYSLDVGVRLMAKRYATAPDYGTVLLSVIHGQNLQQYDA